MFKRTSFKFYRCGQPEQVIESKNILCYYQPVDQGDLPKPPEEVTVSRAEQRGTKETRDPEFKTKVMRTTQERLKEMKNDPTLYTGLILHNLALLHQLEPDHFPNFNEYLKQERERKISQQDINNAQE